jgi:Cu/Ag efflux pump CusA
MRWIACSILFLGAVGEDLIAMTLEMGCSRVRSPLMTVVMNIVGGVPLMIGTETGPDVAKRVANRHWAVSSA